MGLSTQTLMKERFVLQKTFNELNAKIQQVEKEITSMKANLSAVHGALQQVEKMIKIDAEEGRNDGTQANTQPSLDIKPKEEAQLLNENDK
jgi:Skp family chaperone for outer membrane proteins